MRRAIYLDCNASHPLLEGVRKGLADAILQSSPLLGNPSSIHADGQQAKRVFAELRTSLGRFVGRAENDEFVLTSGATEALNLAVRGFVRSRRAAGRSARLIASTVEHSAVLDTVRAMQGEGAKLDLIAVDARGALDEAAFFAALEAARAEDDDALAVLQVANNETGVAFDLEPLLARVYRDFGPGRVVPVANKSRKSRFQETWPQSVWVCLDAAQALGKLDDSKLRRLTGSADYVALCAHKMGGPTGIGALWARASSPLEPLLTGGTQERRRRAGTPNTLGAFGWLLALREWASMGDGFRRKLRAQQRKLFDALGKVPGVVFHGVGPDGAPPELPNTLNLHVEGCPEESLVLALDLGGFLVSSGSACNSGSLKPSHVLTAMGYPREIALSSLRVCVGVETSDEEVEAFLEAFAAKVEQIRAARARAAEFLPVVEGSP